MKKNLFFLLLFVSPVVLAQKTTITGTASDCPDSLEVFAYPPVGPFYNGSIKVNVDKIKNGSFHYSLAQTAPAFLKIENKCIKATLFISPGDTISFRKNDKLLNFEGNNAKGQELINNTDLLKASRIINGLTKILKEDTAPANAIKAFTAQSLKPLDSLLQQNLITTTFSENIRDAVESAMGFNLTNQLLLEIKSGKSNRKFSLTDDQLKSLLEWTFQTYDPFDEKYIKTNTAYMAAIYKARASQQGLVTPSVLPVAYPDAIKENEKPYAFAPKNYQELIWGNNILTNITNHLVDKEELSVKIDFFESRFPESPFLPVIKKEFVSAFEDTANDKDVFFTYNNKTDSVQGLSQTFKTLQELIKTQFKNQYVFVDLWATWCAPCRAEFQYEDKVYGFLQQHHIASLYITFDYPSAKNKWKQFIKDYRLNGFHYFPDPAFTQSMEDLLGTNFITIPRYLLFDNTGKLVISSASRPSTGDKLFRELTGQITN